MARPRLITVGCLNISNPNESANTYINIIAAAFNLRRPIKLSAHKFVILNQLTRDRLGVRGTFARYNEIDPDLPWFDIKELDEADDEATREISIPDNLRPNFVPFFFQFDSQKHKLYFEIRGPDGSISPTEAQKFFATLLSQQEILDQYGPVYVSLVSRRESVDKIIAGLELKKLSIRVQRPNPDDHEDLDQKIRDRLRKQRASSITETLQAAPGEVLEPDEETLALAKVATINGEVSAIGRDQNGASVTRSTRSYPAIETISYDPEVVSNHQAFITAVRSF